MFNNVHNKKNWKTHTCPHDHKAIWTFNLGKFWQHKIKNENDPTLCKFAKALKAKIQAIVKSIWGPKMFQCHAQEL